MRAYLAKGEFSEAQTYFERALDIREQTKVPREIADTLHNLGETLGQDGQVRPGAHALPARARTRGGPTATRAPRRWSRSSIGTIFDYQGRYGAAVKSKGEALQAFRDLKQRDFWLGEILSGPGYSLALGGRADEASKNLDEALALAREIEELEPRRAGPSVPGGERVLQGRCDERRAARRARRFRQAARASDRSLDLWAQFVAANIAAAAQPTKAAAATLAQIGRRAEIAGLTYLSVY